MLDLAKIEQIAQSYVPQELFAALVWQRRFNEFGGRDGVGLGKGYSAIGTASKPDGAER